MVRILVIDDCSSIVVAIKQILNRAGYEVIGAESGLDALKILRGERIDLVITDIHMPDPDGIALLQLAEQERLKMPFIVISGQDSSLKMFRAARLHGAVFTLKKPISRELLVESVEAALDRRYGSEISRLAEGSSGQSRQCEP